MWETSLGFTPQVLVSLSQRFQVAVHQFGLNQICAICRLPTSGQIRLSNYLTLAGRSIAPPPKRYHIWWYR
jgi:hypothetical protein